MFKILVICLLPIANINAFDVNKNDVQKMLKSMQAKGIINGQQAQSANSKLLELSDNEWDQIKDKGRAIASDYEKENKNVSNNADSAAQNINFDSEKFKNIQKQMQQVIKRNE